MKEFFHTIKDPVGIHARPAGLIVKEASKCTCSVTLELGGKSADAKRIFSVMGLGAKCGQTLKIILDGPDEEESYARIKEFFENNL